LKSVGIIANPASGKDIRRLVAYGSVFDNHEKSNIIKRILMALDALGIQHVYIMPDLSGVGSKALDDVAISLSAQFLEMAVDGNQQDSMRAAAMMNAMDVGCIITLGGDGTNRVVAKTCRETPLLPISTGTNNVFPFMIEGTLAGLAAGLLAAGKVGVEECCLSVPYLELSCGNEIIDTALVDLVVTDDAYIGARAVWEPESIKEVFLARARPTGIGFSALGGYLEPIPSGSIKGMHIVAGKGEKAVRAPLAPGLISELSIASYRTFGPSEEIPISRLPATLALDGERELSLDEADEMSVRLRSDGPVVVDIDRALWLAAERNLFVHGAKRPTSFN